MFTFSYLTINLFTLTSSLLVVFNSINLRTLSISFIFSLSLFVVFNSINSQTLSISINFSLKRVFDLKSRSSLLKRKQINHNNDENFIKNLFNKYIDNYQFKNLLFFIQISFTFVDKFSSKISDVHNDIDFEFVSKFVNFQISSTFDFQNSSSKINNVYNDIEFEIILNFI